MLNRIFLTLAIVSSLNFFLSSTFTTPEPTRSSVSQNPVYSILPQEW